MKVTLQAKPLAAQLLLAASLTDTKLARSIAALEAARLVAAVGAISIVSNALDHVLTTTLPATGVERTGEVAVPAARLAALVASFPAEAEITISSGDGTASITCGRSRFKLPTVPITDLPRTPAVDQEIGRIELERDRLLDLIEKVQFAISGEPARYYLHGVLLHSSSEGLTAAATDGHRLARVILPGVGGLGPDRLIVPRPAIKILTKLLADKEIGPLTLRSSSSLIEIASTKFTFISKLIDGTFPAYERLVPPASDNAAIVSRAELTHALERVLVVAPASKMPALVGLTWTDEPVLRVVVPGWDLADDPIAAETSGAGRIALQVRHGRDLLGALKGGSVRIDCDNTVRGSPILITDPDDADFLIVQMPCVWRAEVSQAAA